MSCEEDATLAKQQQDQTFSSTANIPMMLCDGLETIPTEQQPSSSAESVSATSVAFDVTLTEQQQDLVIPSTKTVPATACDAHVELQQNQAMSSMENTPAMSRDGHPDHPVTNYSQSVDVSAYQCLQQFLTTFGLYPDVTGNDVTASGSSYSLASCAAAGHDQMLLSTPAQFAVGDGIVRIADGAGSFFVQALHEHDPVAYGEGDLGEWLGAPPV